MVSWIAVVREGLWSSVSKDCSDEVDDAYALFSVLICLFFYGEQMEGKLVGSENPTKYLRPK